MADDPAVMPEFGLPQVDRHSESSIRKIQQLDEFFFPRENHDLRMGAVSSTWDSSFRNNHTDVGALRGSI